MEIKQQTYQYKNVNYDIEQLLSFYNSNRIDTDLDCQRGYVWSPDRKQQLIDTLMCRERIPEFHAIKENYESIYHIADGKQRITTIMMFVKDQLFWEKKNADKSFYPLFAEKGKEKLLFSELPDNFKNMILNTQLPFACYSNMTPASTNKLFRKLNNGMALSSFQAKLAENIVFKLNFLDGLMEHPVIPKIFYHSQIQNGEAEQALMRTLVLIGHFDKGLALNPSLGPKDIFEYFPKVEEISDEDGGRFVRYLNSYQSKVKAMLDELNTLPEDQLNSGTSTYNITFSMAHTYFNKLPAETFFKLYEHFSKIPASQIVGAGADFKSGRVAKYNNVYSTMVNLLKAPN